MVNAWNPFSSLTPIRQLNPNSEWVTSGLSLKGERILTSGTGTEGIVGGRTNRDK